MGRQLTPDETLLGLLHAQHKDGQPAHGYLLLEHFRAGGGLSRVWNMSTSQVYAVLKRLEACGWITGHEVTPPDAPIRTEYNLTPDGETHLLNWLNESSPDASIRRIRVEFLSRLYIARLLNLPTLPIVLRQKAACKRKLAQLLVERERVAPGMDYLSLEFVIAQMQAVLHWIDRVELVPQNAEEDL